MGKYLVADTYQSMTQVGEPFEKNGKDYIIVREPCPKCGGKGTISHYFHIDHGVCFTCHSKNKLCLKNCTKKCQFCNNEINMLNIKIQNLLNRQKELERMNKAKEKRREKAQAEREARIAKAQAEWPRKNGFDNLGNTWIFVKGDTYAIKDSLKENGYKFNKILGWHGAECLEDLPEGYEICQVGFHEVYRFEPYATEPDFVGKAHIEQLKANAGQGEFVGEIGERLRTLDVQLMSIREYDGAYGLSYIYQFSYKGDILIWMTSKWMDIEPDKWYVLTGTVKKHNSYKGMNQTYLSRCIVKEKDE